MTSHFTNINNVKLHYYEEEEGEAILMLHGFPTSGYLWRNVIPELSKDYRVIALDLPRFGQSDKSHNLQEDEPEKIGQLILDFMKES